MFYFPDNNFQLNINQNFNLNRFRYCFLDEKDVMLNHPNMPKISFKNKIIADT